jgi:hypothetical protein
MLNHLDQCWQEVWPSDGSFLLSGSRKPIFQVEKILFLHPSVPDIEQQGVRCYLCSKIGAVLEVIIVKLLT